MIYTPEHCKLIWLGLKTMTRRVCKEGDELCEGILWRRVGKPYTPYPYDTPYWKVRPIWIVGRTYAIQPGRGKKAIGRTLLLRLRREPLQDIPPEDVEAEGVDVVSHLSSFIHPDKVEALILFTAHRLFRELWDSINPRKGERWADNPDVWAHTFEYVEGSGDD